MVGGAALDGQANDLLGLGVGLFLEAGFDLLDLHGRLVGDFGLQLGDQVGLGLLCGVAGDPFQCLHLFCLELGHLGSGFLQVCQAGVVGFLLALHVLQLAFQSFLLLLETAFLLLLFGASFFDFAFKVGSFSKDLFLGLDQGFPLFAFSAFDGLVDDPLGLLLSAYDFFFRNLLAVEHARGDTYHKRDHECDHAGQDIGQHSVGTHLHFCKISHKIAGTLRREDPRRSRRKRTGDPGALRE